MRSRRLHVLLCGLHFPNGVQRLPSATPSSKLLVVESGRFRILLVDADRLLREQRLADRNVAPPLLQNCGEHGSLKDALNSSTEDVPVSVFLGSLPGYPDNVRLTHSRRHGQIILVGLAAKSSLPFSLLYTAYQSLWVRDVLGRVLPMKMVEKLIPRFGLVLASKLDKSIVSVLQDSSGSLAFVSEAQIHPSTGDLWLGTHHSPSCLSILSESLFETASPLSPGRRQWIFLTQD